MCNCETIIIEMAARVFESVRVERVYGSLRFLHRCPPSANGAHLTPECTGETLCHSDESRRPVKAHLELTVSAAAPEPRGRRELTQDARGRR